MAQLQDAHLGSSAKIVLIDVARSVLTDLEVDILRRILTEARRGRFSVAHAYRVFGPNRASLAPVRELAPLPNEPVFLREELCAFSSVEFQAWVGKASTSLVFLGAAAAAQQSTQTATARGHCSHVLTTAANTTDADPRHRRLLPNYPSRFSAQADLGMSSISYIARGAPNGAS
jgi:hypothetical protein